MTQEIVLRNGMTALCDDEDYPMLSSLPWTADKANGKWYARSGRRLMHRLVTNAPQGMTVHHTNGTLDNTRDHLQVLTPGQHIALHGKMRSDECRRERAKYAALPATLVFVANPTQGRPSIPVKVKQSAAGRWRASFAEARCKRAFYASSYWAAVASLERWLEHTSR